MIPEYYMYEAERIEGNGYIKGQLINQSEEYVPKFCIAPNLPSTKFRNGGQCKVFEEFYEVKPETVQRVEVKLKIYKDGDEIVYECPNCQQKYWTKGGTNYCVECGLKLDWSDFK